MPRSSLGHSWVWFHNKEGESGDIPIALFSQWLNGQSQSVFHGITLTNSSHQHKPPWRSYCCQAWTVETVYAPAVVRCLVYFMAFTMLAKKPTLFVERMMRQFEDQIDKLDLKYHVTVLRFHFYTNYVFNFPDIFYQNDNKYNRR